MRLFLLILATFVTLSSIGCNSDLKCRRETALLRAEPGAQPVVYGSGVQQPFVTHAAQPEIVYYDQAGGYPVEGQTYYAPQYDQSIGYDPYGQPLEFGETPTPAAPRESADGSSLRSSQSVIEGSEEDYYYPSPVETLDPSEPGLDEFEEDSLRKRF